eukprot:Hpha_TRINITY_DN293_c0_g2::TRINITY_DN293_c0_g2_i1::g.83503::m.83503
MRALGLLLFVGLTCAAEDDLQFSAQGARALVLTVLDRLSDPAALLEFETVGSAAANTRKKGTEEQIQEARIMRTASIAERLAREAYQASDIGSRFDEATLHEVLALVETSAEGDLKVKSAMRRIKEIVSGYNGPPDPAATWPTDSDIPNLTISSATSLLRQMRAVLSQSASVKLLEMHRDRIPKGDDSPEALLDAVRVPLEHLTFRVAREAGYSGFNHAMGSCSAAWREHKVNKLARLLADVQDIVAGKHGDDSLGRIYAMDDLAEDFDGLSPQEQEERTARARKLLPQQPPLASYYVKTMDMIRESGGRAVEALSDEVVNVISEMRSDGVGQKEKLRLRKRANILSVFLEADDVAALREKAYAKNTGRSSEL